MSAADDFEGPDCSTVSITEDGRLDFDRDDNGQPVPARS